MLIIESFGMYPISFIHEKYKHFYDFKKSNDINADFNFSERKIRALNVASSKSYN